MEQTETLNAVVVRPPTAGPWFNRTSADELRREWFPPNASVYSQVYLIDLNAVYPTPDVLEAYLVPLALEIKAGTRGPLAVVISVANEAMKRAVQDLASRYALPLFVTNSTLPDAILASVPAADLTPTERETLDAVSVIGGRVTASVLADRLGLQHTAAVNRLNTMAMKGYLHRVGQPGRGGDVFIDPRVPTLENITRGLKEAADEQISKEEQERFAELVDRAANSDSDPGPDLY